MSKLYVELCLLVPLDDAYDEEAITSFKEALTAERRKAKGFKSSKKRYELAKCKVNGCSYTVRGGVQGFCKKHAKHHGLLGESNE